MDDRIPPMRELDAMGGSSFEAAIAPLFEGAPRFVARLAADRPFGSYEQLLERARAVAHLMPEEEQIRLLDSHPRIGAGAGSLSELSRREQGLDGPSAPTNGLQAELDRLNAEYEQRFGFRYVVFVAGRPRAEIAALMAEAVRGDRDAEKARALDDVIAIARDRLGRLAADDAR
jgi:2-oxo-4-hydroxy-4-carboxy-5-ureidoimidazoline decarboxylase